MNPQHPSRLLLTAGLLLAAGIMSLSGGCNAGDGWGIRTKGTEPTSRPAQIPSPIDLLLPREIHIHPFTGTRTFDAAGGVTGIDVRIDVRDAYGDSTKAFGDFHFELYAHDPRSPDPKGKRLASWTESLMEPRKNVLHWDTIAKRYQFKLRWNHAIPVGQKLVLTASFSSPFTDRLSDEHVFVAGQ